MNTCNGFTCHKCGKTGMSSATIIDGLYTCSYCLPNNNLNKTYPVFDPQQKEQEIADLKAELERYKKALIIITRRLQLMEADVSDTRSYLKEILNPKEQGE